MLDGEQQERQCLRREDATEVIYVWVSFVSQAESINLLKVITVGYFIAPEQRLIDKPFILP